MSSPVPFTGLGSAPEPSNPLTNHLRRIKSFKEGFAQRKAATAEHMAVVDHAHGLQKDLIAQANREHRRNESHSAKVHGEMVGSLVTHGVDFGAPGTTKVSHNGLTVETARPKPTAPRKPAASRAKPKPTPAP